MTDVRVEGGEGATPPVVTAAELSEAETRAAEAARADEGRHGEHARRMDDMARELGELRGVVYTTRDMAQEAVAGVTRLGEEVAGMRQAVSVAAEAAAAAVEVVAEAVEEATEETAGTEEPEPAREAPRRKREWA